MTDFWKNKKIIAYIALAHHTRFITPVMEQLQSLGATVKYIVGQAERSQEITAIKLGLPFAHILDYVTEKDHAEIQENYHHLRNIFGNSLKDDFFLGIMPVTVTDKTLFSTAAEYIGFKNLLKKEKPDLCFVLHELNRWGKMFAFWAKKQNIPFITLHEGLMYGKDFGYSGHAQYSTLNLVWGNRIKKKMVSFEAPEAKIIPVGNTHLATEIDRQKRKNIRANKRKQYNISNDFVGLLILSPRLPSPDLLSPIFKTASEKKGYTLFVKFHPACKKDLTDKWITTITKKFKQNIVFVHDQGSTYDLISVCDVVILVEKSTTGLEALAFGKPLVKLDFAYISDEPYSFVDQGVAIKMPAEAFAEALIKKTDFSKLMDPVKIKLFIKNELADTKNAIDTVCTIFKQIIQANQARQIPASPISSPASQKMRDWTLVIRVPDDPDVFLAQLEAIAVNSAEGGTYETLFLLPEFLPHGIQQILDSLEGDITFVHPDPTQSPIKAMNQALAACAGIMILFLDTGLAPLKGWLSTLKKNMAVHGTQKIFGARIADHEGKIAHAGMVVDHNHTPVSAYHRLGIGYKHALKQRSFQMVDHFLAVERNWFFKTGGFSPNAGEYRFLDFCLKIRQMPWQSDPILYLPDLQFIFLSALPEQRPTADGIYFYGKWNGTLWESETQLYKQDGVSLKELAQSKMMAAMQSFR